MSTPSSTLSPEFEELRLAIERLRTLLENLIIRGLRACGTDELLQLQSLTEYLDQAGAGHVSAILSSLHEQIEKDDRASAKTLLQAQISVRLLERLLTLKVVQGQYHGAIAILDGAAANPQGMADADDDES
jgi:hypothetical protein